MRTCVLILENLRSVENTASIFRTAEGLGASKVILVGTTPTPLDRFGRRRQDFAKISLGSEDMIGWSYEKEITSAITNLKEQEFKILALEQDLKAVKLGTYKAPKLFALIIGNEVEGVSRGALDICDEIIEIPMRGKKESLNVSVSTGIALYALMIE